MKSFPTASCCPRRKPSPTGSCSISGLDGRNAVVAIFDTGTTPDGRPKIIDVVDATGAGDVDTSIVIEAKDGQLTLASGRMLTLNPEWKPSQDGKYHVGTVAGFHLFPGPLVTRLKTERKEKFDIEQRAAVNEVQEELAKWSKENSATTNDTAKLREKKDLQTRLKQLEELAKSYEDPGPIYDAVVFNDGTCWRAALDTNETGDFTGIPALTNYKDERQYATFSDESQLNYVLNIYDEGNTLSVVNDVGAHGTHVAGIVAAYHPEQPECNGVAPGAQIVAVKIGDGRLGSMETSSALSRAILAVMDANVDVVNMSYGEYASQHNTVELRHNFSMLSVGAYVSPKMMEGEYIMRDNDLSGIAYTWSSHLGVNICAPGAAIAPVPNWTLNKKQLMNGTSMSSPNCAGNIALLVSAMKAQGIDYTPYSIRRALENTAVKVPNVEVYAQGKAFEYLARSNSFDGTRKFPLHYEITTSSGDGKARGIFLRDSVDFAHDSTEVNVTVTPKFHKKAVQDERSTSSSTLALMHGGRAFKVLVETKHLAAGEHYGEIVAYDTQNETRGALFSIPVIVIKPEDAASVVTYQKKFQPGDISRRFITPPQGATWADIIFSRASGDEREFQPFVRQSLSSFHKAFFLKPGQELAFSMDLLGGLTTEFCLGQFWSALGDSIVQIEIRFHGIKPTKRRFVETETLAPKVSFQVRAAYPPQAAEISPLSSNRDQFPDKRQVYQLVLTYPFTKKEAGKVVPYLPLLNGRLYESPFEAQLMMIFDDKKQYLGCSDAYGNDTTLKKGSYVIRAQQTGETKQMILVLNHDVKEITASVFGHQETSRWLPAGNTVGDILTGKIHFGQKDGAIRGSGRRPGGFDITYVIPPAPTPVKDPESEEPKDERDEEEIAKEARLVDQFPNHLPAMQAKLHHFDFEANRSTQLAEIIEAADAVLALIKQDELALFFAEKKLRKEKEKEKAILADALARKARALEVGRRRGGHVSARFAAARPTLQRVRARLQRLRKVQDMEQADKTKIISDEKLAAEIASTLDALQWKHWTKYETKWERRRAPASYRIF
ncbi:Peptidase S8, subtilisin, Ser-active site [Phytophthora cactorum]|nr:Peptidase S8, subtilisin, Ser-active site [Phytophthora cactorum]